MPESSKLRRALEVVGIARSISPAAPPLTVEIIRRSASRLGLDLHVLDPEYGYLVELVREGDGQSWPLLGGLSSINSAVAARLCTDKFFSSLLLSRAGLNVPPTVRCLGPVWGSLRADYRDRLGNGPARALADRVGFPLVWCV